MATGRPVAPALAQRRRRGFRFALATDIGLEEHPTHFVVLAFVAVVVWALHRRLMRNALALTALPACPPRWQLNRSCTSRPRSVIRRRTLMTTGRAAHFTSDAPAAGMQVVVPVVALLAVAWPHTCSICCSMRCAARWITVSAPFEAPARFPARSGSTPGLHASLVWLGDSRRPSRAAGGPRARLPDRASAGASGLLPHDGAGAVQRSGVLSSSYPTDARRGPRTALAQELTEHQR